MRQPEGDKQFLSALSDLKTVTMYKFIRTMEHTTGVTSSSQTHSSKLKKRLDEVVENASCFVQKDSKITTFVTKGRTIETVPNLYDRKYLDTQYNELLEACAKVNTETMTEQATIVVKDTSNQSSCNAFYRKQTCQTNPV
ncbi:hypothetical protein pdam_00012157 [Pocillopora damicornis]|uniref:Uncharacterized protein n=1 Tax=Pocillopora damicornis TaxID=46731 RepID=A0A3M6UL01_POCDA|nr:hypothetical protein pdam_00012157 [Pocillopora damicornis]